MSDTTQTTLQVPNIDWDNYDTGSKLTAPPQAKGSDGKYIVYYAQLPEQFTDEAFGSTQQGFLKVDLTPLVLVNGGPGIDGYTMKYNQSASAKPYEKNGKTLAASQLGNFLRASGTDGFKPQDIEGYKQAVRAAAGKTIPVILEWDCYDKQTASEVAKKYDDFAGPTGSKSPVITTPDGRTLVARARVKGFVTARQ